jgi:hypothetical protein
MKYKFILSILLTIVPFFLDASQKECQKKYIKRIKYQQLIVSNQIKNISNIYDSHNGYNYSSMQYYYLMGKYQGLGLAKYEVKRKKTKKK